MDKIGLFVSYNHKDKIIADTLVEALSFASQALDVFIDHSSLEGGDDYENKIHESISKSLWFIIICPMSLTSPRDMSYCFYEAGQFRVRLGQENSISEVRNRICCLYDGQIPGPLSRYEGTKISSVNRDGHKINLSSEDTIDVENTELFSLFETIIKRSGSTQLVDLGDDSIRRALRSGVKRVITAFNMVGINDAIDEVVFQPRISFIISPAVDGLSQGLTPDTEIDGGEGTTNLATIFGITGRYTTWKHIKENTISIYKMAQVWISDLEEAAVTLANNNIPVPLDTFCLAKDGNFYIPIVSRYELFRSGKKKCYIVFIPSRSRNFSSTMTSRLLIGLILSVRFRQSVLPIVADLTKIRLVDAAANRRMDLLSSLLRELIAIENEAVEFGLPAARDEYDEPPLLEAFRIGPKKEEIRSEISDWAVIRSALIEKMAGVRSPEKTISATDVANYVIDSFADMKNLNSRFLIDICGELLVALGVDTDPANDALKANSGRL